jgi:Tfp pilus assembly protein FimT
MQGRTFKMIQANRRNRNRVRSRRCSRTCGYTMVELLLVVAIGMILTGIAIPQIRSIVNRYRLQGAIASSTWAIQSTRYQALQLGYPFEVVFTASNNSYQIQSSPLNNATYTNVGTSVPFSGSGTALSADTTLQFKPNGFVSATTGALNFTMSYQGLCQKATVTNYANITLGQIGQTCP